MSFYLCLKKNLSCLLFVCLLPCFLYKNHMKFAIFYKLSLRLFFEQKPFNLSHVSSDPSPLTDHQDVCISQLKGLISRVSVSKIKCERPEQEEVANELNQVENLCKIVCWTFDLHIASLFLLEHRVAATLFHWTRFLAVFVISDQDWPDFST